VPNVSTILNRVLWALTKKTYNNNYLSIVNTLRTSRGLSPIKDFISESWSSSLLNLVAVSPSICEKKNDWGEQHRVCGYIGDLEPSAGWVAPEALKRFINKGQGRLILMTLGSLASPGKSEELTKLMTNFSCAAKEAGCRAVIQTPVLDEDNFPQGDHVYYTTHVSYRDVFPLCDLIVHHGGAGTLHLACAAGVPSVIVPSIEEQYFWNEELKRLGVACEAVRINRLTPENLGRAIKKVLNCPNAKSNAQQLALNMKGEDGLASAVNILEETFTKNGSLEYRF